MPTAPISPAATAGRTPGSSPPRLTARALRGGPGEARPRLWRQARATASTCSCRRPSRKDSSSSSMAATGCASTIPTGRIWRKGAVDSGYRGRNADLHALPRDPHRRHRRRGRRGDREGRRRWSTGPIHLTGHSAGGHLASRMICANSPLVRSRAQAHRQHRVDLRRARSSADDANRHERRRSGSTMPRRLPKARRCSSRSTARASPAGSAAASAPSSSARARCSPMPGSGSAPRRRSSRSPTGTISPSLTGSPIRPIP